MREIKINYCSQFINRKIYSILGYEIVTISDSSKVELERKKRISHYSNRIKSFNPNDYLNHINSFTQTESSIRIPSEIKNPEIIPSMLSRKGIYKIIELNNLAFISVRGNKKNRKVTEKKMVSKDLKTNERKLKSLPTRTQLILDKNNKRIKLKGLKTNPEWIDIEIPNNSIRYNRSQIEWG